MEHGAWSMEQGAGSQMSGYSRQRKAEGTEQREKQVIRGQTSEGSKAKD